MKYLPNVASTLRFKYLPPLMARFTIWWLVWSAWSEDKTALSHVSD